MPEGLQTPPATAPENPPASGNRKSPLGGWRLVLLVIVIVAGVLCGLLAIVSYRTHNNHARIDGPAVLPAWPLKAGDVFTLKPGDPLIAKWAESPDNDGFLVQLVEQNGKPIADAKVCALEPDYMADAAQPGGTLTLISQDGTGDWRVHWTGGDTIPPAEAAISNDVPPQANANCGKDAVFTMSQAQLHAWHDMQAGIVVPLSKNAPDTVAPGSAPASPSTPDAPPSTPPSDSTLTH